MRFDIELLGFDGEAPIDGLAKAFEIDPALARSIAGRAPVFVKRDVDEKTAEGYFHTLRQLGARVKLHRHATMPPPKSSPPESISMPPPIELEADPLARPSVPITPRSAPPPAMAEAAAIPALAIELEDVPRSTERRSERPASNAPAAATAQINRAPEPVDREIADKGGYINAVARAYVYPFQKTALPALIAVPLITQLASYVPAFVGLIISNGIWISYLFAVTQHASLGRDDLPLAPETETWLDMLGPLVRYVLAFLVPGILIFGLFVGLTGGIARADALVTGEADLTMASIPVLVFVATGLWLVYLPASLILAAHSKGCLGGLNLIAGVKLIIREPVGYAVTLAGIAPAALLMVAFSIGSEIADSLIPIPFVPGLVGLMLTFIPALIVARILGLYLWHHEEELGLG